MKIHIRIFLISSMKIVRSLNEFVGKFMETKKINVT